MPEPSGEHIAKELDQHRWINHGALEICFLSSEETTHKKQPYLCKSLINGSVSSLTHGEMAMVLALDPDIAKSRDQIRKDHKRRLEGLYRNHDLNREVLELSDSSFGVLLHKLQSKIGYDSIQHISRYGYKIIGYPKK